MAYPFLLVEAEEWNDNTSVEVGAPEKYFATSWNVLNEGSDQGLTFRFIDDTNLADDFFVAEDLVEFSVNDTAHPSMAVTLMDSKNLENGVYGVTRYFKTSATYSADTEECNLTESVQGSNALTCSWMYHDLVAVTEIRKDLYERGMKLILV